MKRSVLLISASALVAAQALAAPLDQLGVKPGSTHRLSIGAGEIDARTIEIGKDGWVLFSVESNDVRWSQGTRLWINLDRVNNISAPMTATASTSGVLSESEIARMPCFPQTDYRDALASAKGQPFDRNRFLTECISNKRKK